MVHAAPGPHLVGVWYRPPAPGELATINTFKTELSALEGISLGTIVLGDMNVHNTRRLRHSRANSVEGSALKAACDDAALQQIVKTRTLENHLLDLVLTDMSGSSASVLPAITNHKVVKAELSPRAVDRHAHGLAIRES